MSHKSSNLNFLGALLGIPIAIYCIGYALFLAYSFIVAIPGLFYNNQNEANAVTITVYDPQSKCGAFGPRIGYPKRYAMVDCMLKYPPEKITFIPEELVFRNAILEIRKPFFPLSNRGPYRPADPDTHRAEFEVGSTVIELDRSRCETKCGKFPKVRVRLNG